MLQARVTIKSLLTGYQPLFTDRARACAPSSLHGAPRAAGAGAIRGGPGWPVTALVLPMGGQAQGQVLETPRVSQGPDKGLLLAERGSRCV